MITTAAGLTDPGCKRERNEDRILVDVNRGVFVLADGMGGEHCGELAAEIAVRCVGDFLLEKSPSTTDPHLPHDSSPVSGQERVVNAVRLANMKVWETAQSFPDCSGMGTTISVVLHESESIIIGNIGDSRVYLYRNNQLQRLTRDDALVSQLVDQGKITVEKAKTHPLRNVLTLALGRFPDINVQLLELPLQTDDQLLLASDGLHGVLPERDIMQIIGNGGDPLAKAQALIDAAKKQGGPDNISCIVIACR
jgi:serine/threonine protein phosphatase PrpC